MCFPTQETNIPSDMCSAIHETHIPSEMCFSNPGNTCRSLVIFVPLPGNTYATLHSGLRDKGDNTLTTHFKCIINYLNNQGHAMFCFGVVSTLSLCLS